MATASMLAPHGSREDRAALRGRIPRYPWARDPKEPRFAAGLAALAAFSTREGHTHVPKDHREGDLALGTWLDNRRAEERRGELSPERIAALEAIAPGFSWRPRGQRTEQMLSRLRRFHAREGHLRVPQRHREDGLPLGRWVEEQRRLRRAGEPCPALAAILAIDPAWDCAPRRHACDRAFERGLAALSLYVSREGHGRVPAHHREGDLKLGEWLANRRAEALRGDLRPDRLARLRAVLPGFPPAPRWSTRRGLRQELTPRFRHALALVASRAARDGLEQLRTGDREDGLDLYAWVDHQRWARREGRLSPARIAAIQARIPGFPWSARGSGGARSEAGERARPADL
jgi:hypothetical protein